MRSEQRKKRKRSRSGTTLVETIVCLMLISILMAMAAQTLSSASRIFVEVQKTQYAQSILDTTMTELRAMTRDATTYVKIYRKVATADTLEIANRQGGNAGEAGDALEFVNEEGYAVLLSTAGFRKTTLVGGNSSGEADAVETGRLVTRYYARNADGSYVYKNADNQLQARAVALAFGNGFYMGNYLEVKFFVPDNTAEGADVTSVTAEVTLYSDKDKTNVIAKDTEILDFRHEVKFKREVTAKKG